MNLDWKARVFQSYALGIGYDVMNGAIFGALAVLVPFPIFYRKIVFGLVGLGLFAFLFADYHYVLLFGTHLPFSSYEYVNDTEIFWSSVSMNGN